MKKFTALALALTLLGSTAVLAAPNGNDRNRGAQQNNRNDDRNNNNGRFDNDRHDNDRNDRNEGRNVRDMPHWSRGDRLPTNYRGRQYEISDWRARHLRQPPRGYHWVQADNRYVLAAVASGLITDIILNAGR